MFRASPRPGSRALRGALLCLLCLSTSAALRSAISIAIVPPYIEKVVRAGSKVSDTISFTNQGTETVSVGVDFADFGVSEQGDVSEEPPGTQPASLVRFVRVSPTRVRVAPNQQVFFRYAVETPQDFKQLKAMIYFSSRPEIAESANQVVMIPRMGIPLYIENMKAKPASLKLDEIKWERSGEKSESLLLSLHVKNEGERNIRPTGFLQVRSVDGKFDRVFDFNDGREPVLPGQRRRWAMSFGPVPGGELFVKLRFTNSPRTTIESEHRVPAAGG